MSSSSPRILVIGGGLAGMSAAVALESAGLAVTLLESRRHLGGRASSFPDPQTGQLLDNCQHILLGCCTNLLDFYNRLGVADRIAWHRTIPYLNAAQHRYELSGIPHVPAPLHLGPATALFGALTLRQRLAVFRAMLAILATNPQTLADIPFGQWLDEHHQDDATIRHFYDPVLVGALNEDSRRASCAYAMQVFQLAMLNHADGYLVGLPTCPLSDLYGRLPCRDVRLGQRVAALRFANGRVSAVELADGSTLSADAYVLAVPHQTLARWLPPELLQRDSRFTNLDRLEPVPILGVHLWFDRPVLAEPFVALLDGPLHWLFRKDSAGQAVHGVISAARDWADRSRDQCLQLFAAQVRSTLPRARQAQLLRGVVVIEKRATFSPAPGVDRFRPDPAPPPSGVENLFLAGDYTRTGWPATMEGAVRGGYLAAEAVLARQKPHNPSPRFIVPDLQPQWPARLIRQLLARRS